MLLLEDGRIVKELQSDEIKALTFADTERMGKTVFIVTHDLEFILSCCDHIVRLEEGNVVENYELNQGAGAGLCQFFANNICNELFNL